MQHLKTHPAVAAKLATKAVQLHGWVYDIETGMVHCYDPETDSFKEMEQAYAERTLVVGA